MGKNAIPKSNSICHWRAKVEGISALSQKIDDTVRQLQLKSFRNSKQEFGKQIAGGKSGSNVLSNVKLAQIQRESFTTQRSGRNIESNIIDVLNRHLR